MMEKHIVVKPKNNEKVIIRLRIKKNSEEKIVIEHQQSNTSSHVHIKAVVFPGAQSTIRALIRISKDLHRVSAFLKITVLLVDETARAEVQPNLEIESNDVRCSHASSISTIDQKQVHYLMSKGITEKQAKRLLIEGFLE